MAFKEVNIKDLDENLLNETILDMIKDENLNNMYISFEKAKYEENNKKRLFVSSLT